MTDILDLYVTHMDFKTQTKAKTNKTLHGWQQLKYNFATLETKNFPSL